MALKTQTILTSQAQWIPPSDYDDSHPVKIVCIGKGGTGQDDAGKGAGAGGRSVYNSVTILDPTLCVIDIDSSGSFFTDDQGRIYGSQAGQNGVAGGAGGIGDFGTEAPDVATNGGAGGTPSAQAGGGGGETGGSANGNPGGNAVVDVGGLGGTGGTGADGGKGGNLANSGEAGKDDGGGGGGGGLPGLGAAGGRGSVSITYTTKDDDFIPGRSRAGALTPGRGIPGRNRP